MSGYTAQEIATARSLLFVPGNRPERFEKAAAAQPDIVIVDLEDAVADADKDVARAQARAWLNDGNAAMMRINATDTAWHHADLDLVNEFAPPVMLPKSENIDHVRQVGALHNGNIVVVPLVETAAGILAAAALSAQTCVVRLAFGSIDLATQIGVDPDDRDSLLFARSTLVMASAAAGCAPPIDGVTTTIDPPQSVIEDFHYAQRLGMTAKLCIHPKQVDHVHTAAAPSADTLKWAQDILAEAKSGGSAVAIQGRMVDKPVLERARKILARSRSDTFARHSTTEQEPVDNSDLAAHNDLPH
jgi:citrate lyase subunit beta/citryl-CoA lyase